MQCGKQVQMFMFCQEYAVRNRFGEIRVSMFKPAADKFPSLRGRAGEVRDLAEPLLKVWLKYMDVANQQHRLVRMVLKASVAMEAILKQNVGNYRLPPVDATAFAGWTFQYNACVAALGNYFRSRGVWLFHFTIKNHYLLHIALDAGQTSPAMTWCYQGEDLMHKVKILVQASCRGTCPQKLVSKFLKKYMHGISYDIMDPQQWWH